RRTVTRFMPGETAEDALGAAQALQAHGISAVFTHLGENINEAPEALRVTDHYVALLDQIRTRGLNREVSVKLTQLGLDLSSAHTSRRTGAACGTAHGDCNARLRTDPPHCGIHRIDRRHEGRV